MTYLALLHVKYLQGSVFFPHEQFLVAYSQHFEYDTLCSDDFNSRKGCLLLRSAALGRQIIDVQFIVYTEI